MPFQVSYEHNKDYVIARVAGEAPVEAFLAMLQDVGAESVTWQASAVMVDLRGVETRYSFTEQLRIGEAVARNLRHLRRAAALVPAERITRVGEKAANHLGATVRVFSSEAEALDWIRN
ncbi:MAG TPA: STAS/SEC14 domain-containing protein [Ramlibacter sp.]|nr:STAS/SEC14 domain-containing protein [Ramlibacter sp.]